MTDAPLDETPVPVSIMLPRWMAEAMARWDRLPYAANDLAGNIATALRPTALTILEFEESRRRRALYDKLGLPDPCDGPDDLPF